MENLQREIRQDTRTTKVGDTWTKQEKWFIDNILELLEQAKAERLILNERITKLEMEAHNEKQKEKTSYQSTENKTGT